MKSLVIVAALVALAMPAAVLASPAPTGDQHRTYVFARTGQTMPYRLFVPNSYDAGRAYPLVVVLHGAGGDENRAFAESGLVQIAQQRGVILLAPLGYTPFGGYGDIYPVVVTRETAAAGKAFRPAAGPLPRPEPAAPALPAPALPAPALPAVADDYAEQPAAALADPETSTLSEAETLAALADVRARYRIDPARIYLMGNSMGGVGTQYLAAKYPTLWAAICPAGGPVAAWSYPFWRLREARLPVLFVHGALDEHANPRWSRVLEESARAEGVDAQLIVIAGGHHADAWTRVLPQTFAFFAAHARRVPDRDTGSGTSSAVN